MKTLHVRELAVPDIKIVTYRRFLDKRGYFCETFRAEDVDSNPDLSFLQEHTFVQMNESYSRRETFRGLHVQWDPAVGKLVRVIQGCMIDVALDLRVGSPYYGHVVTREIYSHPSHDLGEWIWIPPGFAHGCAFLEDTHIEYFCTAPYRPDNEATINVDDECLVWEDTDHQKFVQNLSIYTLFISDKDSQAMYLEGWASEPAAERLTYESSRMEW